MRCQRTVTDTTVERLLLVFDKLHRDHLDGVTYLDRTDIGRDCELVRDLVEDCGEVLAERLIEEFWGARRWLQDHQYDLDVNDDPRTKAAICRPNVPGLLRVVPHLLEARKARPTAQPDGTKPTSTGSGETVPAPPRRRRGGEGGIDRGNPDVRDRRSSPAHTRLYPVETRFRSLR